MHGVVQVRPALPGKRAAFDLSFIQRTFDMGGDSLTFFICILVRHLCVCKPVGEELAGRRARLKRSVGDGVI